MIGQAVLVFGLRGLGALSALAFQFGVARLLAPDLAGEFFLVLSATTILYVIPVNGMNYTALRHGAPLVIEGRLGQMAALGRSLIKLAIGNSVILAVVLAIAFLVSRAWMDMTALISGDGVAVLIVGFSLFALRALGVDLLRCYGRTAFPTIALSLLPNGLSGLGVMVCLLGGFEIEFVELLVIWLAGLFATVVWTGALVLRLGALGDDRSTPAPSSPLPPDAVFRNGLPIMLSQVSYQLAWSGGVWLAALQLGKVEAATVALCLRMAELVALPGSVIAFLGQPVVATSLRFQRPQTADAAMRSLATLVALPTGLLLIIVTPIASELLDVIFGPSYASGGPLLVMVLISRWIDNVGGVGGYAVLALSDHKRVLLSIIVTCGIGFLALTPLLTMSLGLNGIGIGILAYYIARSSTMAFTAWKVTGIRTWPVLSKATFHDGAAALRRQSPSAPQNRLKTD